jgi:2-polyprenyl-3-methyl-5-hydroxy-6-metoxy-1,4-benzoquinol methylase
MVHLPDWADPRYLDEVGWFLYHERYERQQFGGSYDDERLEYSRLLLDEVLGYCGQAHEWLADKAVVSVGCGCTGDLAAWPAALKIAVDPLLYAYQKLDMLVDDIAGTSRTIYLAMSAEDLPLLDECADLVICRNALDHMQEPAETLRHMWRILKADGRLFLSVDIGGVPTPDEPTVFSLESLLKLLRQGRFEVVHHTRDEEPHSGWRPCSVRILAQKKPHTVVTLDKDEILQAYLGRLGERG